MNQTRPDIPERLASLETSFRYETKAIHERMDRIEQTVSHPHRLLPALDGPAITKLALAGLLALVMVALNATGHSDTAAKLGGMFR